MAAAMSDLPAGAEIQARLGDGQAADQVARKDVRRQSRQAGLDLFDQARSDDGL